MRITRRNSLASIGGVLLVGGVPATADARTRKDDLLYGHGMVWNRELPGEAGSLSLSFDIAAHLDEGIGRGTAADSIQMHWNLHFEITEITSEELPKKEIRYQMLGTVVRAANAANVGLAVRVLAETQDALTVIAIRLGELDFAGAGALRVGYCPISSPIPCPFAR